MLTAKNIPSASSSSCEVLLSKGQENTPGWSASRAQPSLGPKGGVSGGDGTVASVASLLLVVAASSSTFMILVEKGQVAVSAAVPSNFPCEVYLT